MLRVNMKLGIDASRANKKEKTGTEWYAWEMLRRLPKYIPPELEVLLYTREPLEKSLIPEAKNWIEEQLDWPPRRVWTLIRLSYEMLRRPPDLLWIPTHTIPFFAPKTVVTIHDVGFLARPDLYNAVDRAYHQFSTSRIVKNAQHIFTVSEFSKQEIVKFCKVSPERISVTPLAASEAYRQHTETEINAMRIKYNLSKPYFIFVGRLEKKKNIDGLVKAFSIFREKNKDTELILVGRSGYGADAARETISGVRVFGYVDRKDLPSIVSGAIAFILPSHYEGFGIPVLEAMASGTPVISSNAGSLPEVAGNAAIYIDPNNIEEIAHAMSRIWSESALGAQLRERGYLRAKDFSWDKTAELTWRKLEDMI